MAMELCYTSAPKGLAPGSRGFCTVAATAGMPAPLIERLESLSGYRPLNGSGGEAQPVNHAHRRITQGGQVYSVLSRIAYAGADYTRRSNKFAHHLALRQREWPPAGPAWVLHQPGVVRDEWVGEPTLIPQEVEIPQGDVGPDIARAWGRVAGDAGWAGVLAEAFVLDRSRPAYVIYQPGEVEPLTLVAEALVLLSPRRRWEVNFSTYFTDLPAGTTCHWRFVVAGTAAAEAALKTTQDVLRIDLASPLRPPTETWYVRLARTGVASGDPPAAAGEVAACTESAPYDLAVEPEPGRKGRRSRSRTRGGARVPGEASDHADAAPVPANGHEPHRTRRPALLLALAAGWPLAAGALVYATLFASPSDVPLSATAPDRALQGEVTRLEAELAAAQGQVADLQRQVSHHAGIAPPAHAAPHPAEAHAPAGSSAPIEAASAAIVPRGTAAHAPPAPTDTLPPALASGLTEQPTQPAIRPAPGVERLEGVPHRYAASLPPPPFDHGLYANGHGASPITLLRDLQPGTTLEVVPPLEANIPRDLSFQTEGHRVHLVHEQADALGARQAVVLAEAAIIQDDLVWRWHADNTSAALQRRASDISHLARHALLRMRDSGGQTLVEVQFVPPQIVRLRFGTPVKLEHAWVPSDPRLAVASAAQAWRAQVADDGGAVQFQSEAGARFRVALVGSPTGDSRLLARWGEHSDPETLTRRAQRLDRDIQAWNDRAEAYLAARDELNAAEARLPRADNGEVDRSVEGHRDHRSAFEAHARAQQAIDALRRSADTDLDLLARRYLEAQADLDQVRAQLADTRVARAHCVLQGRSGVLLAKVEVAP